MKDDNTHIMDASKKPHPKLKELTGRLTGTWRVTGQGINGKAEYRSAKDGFLLVQDIDFTVSGTKMKVMQHISYDEASNTLQALYMDTMGNNSTYIWALDGQMMRVSHGNKDSGEYFEAKFNSDNSEYSGTWHYPAGEDHGEEAPIVYRRINE